MHKYQGQHVFYRIQLELSLQQSALPCGKAMEVALQLPKKAEALICSAVQSSSSLEVPWLSNSVQSQESSRTSPLAS